MDVFSNRTSYDDCCSIGQHVIARPIIYFYPEKETEITVRLGAPERLTASYPKYIDEWNVIAYPDGSLIDKSSGNILDGTIFDCLVGGELGGINNLQGMYSKKLVVL